jgi:hypothetical protein
VFKLTILITIILLLASCSSQEKVEKSKTDLEIKKELKSDEVTKKTDIYFLKDKNKYPIASKNSQIKITNKVKDSNELLYTKEYDFNSDGKNDMLVIYNSKKEIEKIYSDLDFDLKHDVIDYYKNNKLNKRELLSDITQKPYIIIQYDNKNNIQMTLFDKNLDGEPDYKSLYKDGQLYEIQIDSNADGKFNIIKKIKIKKNKEEDGK